MRLGRRTVLIITLAQSGRLAALEPGDFAETWRWRTFGREEGLPTGTISAIGHDRDDYVYAGTERGLLRYNGFTWSALDSAEPFTGGPVVRIVESGGNVYASTRSEVWLARYGLELHRILKNARVLLAAGPVGGVYAIDLAGQVHYSLEKETLTRVDDGAPLPESEIHDYAVDDRRLHWLATRDGLYRRDIRGRFRWQSDPELGPELRGRPCRRLFVLKRPPPGRGPAGAPPSAEPASFELWALFEGPAPPAGSPGGGFVLARKVEQGWRVTAVDPSAPAISDLVLDGDGNYLAVSEESRVFISGDGKSWAAAPNPGIGWFALSGGFLDRHDYLWYRAGSSAIVRFDGQSRRWERYHRGMGLPSNNVLSLVEATDGSLWVGTDNGVYRYPRGEPGDPVVYRKIGDRELKSITGLAEDRTGKIWISSESFNGAFFFHEGQWNRFAPRGGKGDGDLGLSAHPIRRIVADRGGDLWFLSAARAEAAAEPGDTTARPPGYLMYRYSASVFVVSTFRALEFAHGPVNDLLQGQDKKYWLATEEGLVSTNAALEKVRLYTQADGLRSSRIWAIAEAADGSIWVCYDPSSASGVTRIRDQQVEKTFDERNGLASPNAWSVASTITPEGTDVWFGTDRGLTRFDGECWYNYPLASLDPQASQVWPICIAGERSPGEGISILLGTFGQGVYRFRRDDRRRPRITLLDSERTPQNLVTFRWDGRDFKNETQPADLRFRTRIDNQPWTVFGAERTRSMAGLASGDHVFQVEMRDLDGNSNREKYAIHFHVPALPALRSPIIWAVMGGAGGGLVLAALGAAVFLKLRRRPAPVRATLDASRAYAGFPGAAVVLDRDGRIVALTGRRPENLGLPPELARELLGRPAALLPLFQSDRTRPALERLLAGEALLVDAVPLVPGQARTAQVRGIPLVAGGDPPGAGEASGAVLLVEEVTASRRAGEVRERARRLSSLQDLAGRIASEFASGGSDPRAEELLRTLRRFAGEEDLQPETFPLGGILDGLLGKSLNGIGGGGPVKVPAEIEVDRREQTGLWPARGDRRGVEVALAELLKNAVEAMPEGGRLTVRVRNRRLEEDPGILSAGAYLEVEVGDSGPGFPPAEMHRAFEPFFSTKPRDRARGMGLSVAYGLVRRQGGDIRLASVSGEGTTVTVYLPADPGA